MAFNYFSLLLFLLFILIVTHSASTCCSNLNLTHFKRQRAKRALIFEGGGNIKLVVGPILPFELADPIEWRSILSLYNLQGPTYNIPTKPLYPWDKWEQIFARSMQQMRSDLDRMGAYRRDDTREFVYNFLEHLMSSRAAHGNGRACLMRSICQNAQVQQHAGLYAELLNILLTPGNTFMAANYKEAYKAGSAGANCLHLYHKCPLGTNFLDGYLDEL